MYLKHWGGGIVSLILIIFAVLFSGCTKEAQHFETTKSGTDISIEYATKVAKNFAYDQVFHQDNNNIKNIKYRSPGFVSDKKIMGVLTIKYDNHIPAFYVIQFDPEGFIIVAGTKKETPILAYSETGYFEYNPLLAESNGLNEWVETRKEKIKNLINNPLIGVADSIEEQWDYSAPPIDDEIIVAGGVVNEQKGPLLSTNWDQGCGYNSLLNPCTSGGQCGRVWTGCVATATAQVMRYWQHPTTYTWSTMPNNTGSAETSRLMRDIGTAVYMSYGCGGSAAYTSDARNALVNTFGYSGSAAYVNYNASTLVTQLNASWPVILRGQGTGGHAWVCDGYKRNKYISIHNPGTIYEYETYTLSPLYLRMNWGWGQYGGNGWFLYNDFTPGSNNFNTDRKMIINIHP
jgi:hypothetical protein